MYKPNELKDGTTGIYKRFPKLSTYKKNIVNWGVDYSKEKFRLDKCANGEVFSFSHLNEEQSKKFGCEYAPKPYSWIDLKGDLSRYSTRRILDSYVLCFEGNNEWKDVFREAIAYRYWSTRMELVLQEIALKEYTNGERKQKLTCHLRDVGITIGFCITLGWLDYARDLRDRINFSLENEMVNDGFDQFGRRRTQHFLIRLMNSFDGLSDIQAEKDIKSAYDAPLLNEVIENWDGDCSENFIGKIYELCDRHTHQCRQDSFNNNRYYDFENMSLEYYFPVEILSVYKLREKKSLKIPNISHPLLNVELADMFEDTVPYESEYLNSLINFAKSQCNKI